MVSREGWIETENEEESKSDIWQKEKIISGTDPDEYRKDESGYWMKYDQFRTHAKMAWDYERRSVAPSGESEYHPIAAIRLNRIDNEVDKVIDEKD